MISQLANISLPATLAPSESSRIIDELANKSVADALQKPIDPMAMFRDFCLRQAMGRERYSKRAPADERTFSVAHITYWHD